MKHSPWHVNLPVTPVRTDAARMRAFSLAKAKREPETYSQPRPIGQRINMSTCHGFIIKQLVTITTNANKLLVRADSQTCFFFFPGKTYGTPPGIDGYNQGFQHGFSRQPNQWDCQWLIMSPKITEQTIVDQFIGQSMGRLKVK